MRREEKTTLITDLTERLSTASLGIVTEYRGLTVAQMNKLRRELQAAGASYRVSKNTLTRRAIKETAFAKLHDLLRGPTGLVTSEKDPVAVAKILVHYEIKATRRDVAGLTFLRLGHTRRGGADRNRQRQVISPRSAAFGRGRVP